MTADAPIHGNGPRRALDVGVRLAGLGNNQVLDHGEQGRHRTRVWATARTA